MNLLSLRTEVRDIFGDNSGALITDTQINRWLNQAITEFNRDVELSTAQVSLTPVGNQADDGKYTTPTDFDSVDEVSYNNRNLSFLTYEEWAAKFPLRGTDTAGEPVYWIRDNTDPNRRTVILFPYPSTAGIVNAIVHTTSETQLVSDTDVPLLPSIHHETLIYYALMKCCMRNDDGQRAILFRTVWQERIAAAQYNVAQSHSSTYPAVRDVDTEMYPQYSGWD